ncbi:MAG TPA: tetratricopeptide repeat protein [Candidatus Avalokitesvara rifleensis]|uniref:tetratricopeptide repeat protein n=1 Tax=Candidatus Avalokitesvara rifleensis TaxID=3367620 RepID=UPI002712FA98|nr:tetratricopeptide repeat protein [Candidatus Brocadiales bacterium]
MTCNNPESHFNRATDLFGQGRLNDAMEELREALRLRPDYPEAHYNLGLLLSELKRHGEAEKEYREALRLRPDFMLAYNNLFVLLIKRKAYEKAWEEYVESHTATGPRPSFQQVWKVVFLFIRALPQVAQITLFFFGVILFLYALKYLYDDTTALLFTLAMGIVCIVLGSRLFDIATMKLFQGGPEVTLSKSEPSKGTSKEE